MRGVGRREVIAGIAAGALGGCARKDAAAPLTFWAMGDEGDYSPLLMPSFTRATGLSVETQSLPWTAAHEKLLIAHAGGSLPDVMMLPNGWAGEFAMIGALAPVPDPALLDDLFPGTRNLTHFGGHDWGIPWAVAPQGIFYRPDILAAAGYDAPAADWEGFRRMGLALKKRRPDDYVVLLYLNWWDALFTFAGQTGRPVLRDRNTRGDFSTPEFKAAFAFYKSLYDDGLAPKALSIEIQDPVAAFAQGYFSIYPSSPTLLLDLYRRVAEIPLRLWATARMPGPRGPGPASSTSGCIAVASTTPRPREAWALAAHLTSSESELRFQRAIGKLPARVSAWRDPQMAVPYLRAFGEQMHDSADGPNIVEWERVRSEVQLVAERVVRGMMTLDEGVREMDRRADHVLAERRRLVEAGRIA